MAPLAPPATSAPPGAPASPAGPSSLLKAGGILLLVGAILATVGAALLLVVSAFMFAIGENYLGEEDQATFPFAVVGGVYVVLGILLAVGAVLGYQAWGRAKAGDARAAWMRGLVASLLPPLQVVSLVGAILCLVSPEGEEQGRRQRSQAP